MNDKADSIKTSTIDLPALRGTDDELEFRDFMAELFAAAGAMQNLRRNAAKVFGLSSSQLAILLAITRLGNHQSIRKLADHLDIAASNVTADVRRLEHRGLLIKRPDPSDSRAIHVLLTDDGHQLVQRMGPVIRSINNSVFEGLSRADMLTGSAMLKNIVTRARRLKKRT